VAGRRGDSRGFTLLEILIVLVIIAIAATVVAPSLESGFRARELRSAVRAVAGSLRGMQSDAIRSGKTGTLVIDPVRNALAVDQTARTIDLGDVAGIVQIHGGELAPGGVVRVNFYPNGSTSGLAVWIADRESPGDSSYVVRLDPLIGLVTVRDVANQ